MFLEAAPDLKIVENKRLHIRRRPTFVSWLLLFLSVVFFVVVFRRLTDNLFFIIVSLMGQTMFGLDAFARWEDLTLDKPRNSVLASRYTWSERLAAGNSKENVTTIMRLTDVCHVGVSVNMGLFFVRDDGRTVGIDTRGLTRDEIQNRRRLIERFINANGDANFLHSSADSDSLGRHTLDSDIFRAAKRV